MTSRWIARDTWAKFFINKLMERHGEPGYSDQSAIAEGFYLADFALKVRKGVKPRKTSAKATQEGDPS